MKSLIVNITPIKTYFVDPETIGFNLNLLPNANPPNGRLHCFVSLLRYRFFLRILDLQPKEKS